MYVTALCICYSLLSSCNCLELLWMTESLFSKLKTEIKAIESECDSYTDIETIILTALQSGYNPVNRG